MGKEKEPACHELRQAFQITQAVLQEGHHEEDREDAEARLPVLFPLSSLKNYRERIYKFNVYRFFNFRRKIFNKFVCGEVIRRKVVISFKN